MTKNDDNRRRRVEEPLRDEMNLLSTVDVTSLRESGYTNGLIKKLATNRRMFPNTIWVIDNSDSMNMNDGHRIIYEDGSLCFITCTRWRESVESALTHFDLAVQTRRPTTFRLLNHPGPNVGPQIFSVDSSTSLGDDLIVAKRTMRSAQPGGHTPLTAHILAIHEIVEAMQDDVLQNGQKVAIVIATDGLPSDAYGDTNERVQQEFVAALFRLIALPVWIVVRLCTDDRGIVNFWNSLEKLGERPLEVIDDFISEAKEVYKFNPWLTYALPIHRMRESGMCDLLFDKLDEKKFTRAETRQFLSILLDNMELPDPDKDWTSFVNMVTQLVNNAGTQWNPIQKRRTLWVDIGKLRRVR